MPGLLRILFPLALAGPVLVLIRPPEAATEHRYAGAVPAGAALAELSRWPGGDPQEGLVRARTVAEQLRTGVAPRELLATRNRLAVTSDALSRVAGAERLPWADWIDDAWRSNLPELALELFVAARSVLPPEKLLTLAARLDERATPRALRIEVHRAFWDLDPKTGANRFRRLLRKDGEPPRANDTLRADLILEVLAPHPSPRVDELLELVVPQQWYPELARRNAIRALVRRGATQAAPSLESVFDSEDRNLLLRQESLNALVALDPLRAREILTTRVPDPRTNPGLYEYFRRKRAELGMEPLPE